MCVQLAKAVADARSHQHAHLQTSDELKMRQQELDDLAAALADVSAQAAVAKSLPLVEKKLSEAVSNAEDAQKAHQAATNNLNAKTEMCQSLEAQLAQAALNAKLLQERHDRRFADQMTQHESWCKCVAPLSVTLYSTMRQRCCGSVRTAVYSVAFSCACMESQAVGLLGLLAYKPPKPFPESGARLADV